MLGAVEGSVEEQLEKVKSLAIWIVEKERKLRTKVADNYPTIVLNKINKSLCLKDNSLLLEYKESQNIILGLKIGLNLSLLKGISNKELNLWYVLMDKDLLEHFLYVENDFQLEKDVIDNELLIERMRAIVIQNGLIGITHGDNKTG